MTRPIKEPAMPDEPPAAAVYTIRQPLTLEEVAQILRVSVKTVQRHIAAERLQAFQAAGKRGGWRVRPEWLDEFMNRDADMNARGPRPLGDVHRVDPAAEQQPMPRRPKSRRQRNASGTLAVKPGMGRAA